MSAPDDGYSSGDSLNLSNIGASNNNARNNNVENGGDVPPAAVPVAVPAVPREMLLQTGVEEVEGT